MENKHLHDKAWQLLEEKGLTISQRMMVRANFIAGSGYKEEYPFITTEYKKGEIEWYHSEYEEIKHFRFKTENEVILANSLYVNMLDEDGLPNVNDFIQTFKYVCRVAGIKSNWV